MTQENLSDYKFLSNFIYNKIGLKLNVKNLSIINSKEMDCWGGLSCKQYPDELAKLLVFIYNNRKYINSYCEIGAERGGTFFVIDSFLRSINTTMGESLAIDIKDKIYKHGFEEYQNKYGKVKFLQIDSASFKPNKIYDLCLIDGDHSYKGCKRDFETMRLFSKFIAMHDVKCPFLSVKDLWDQIEAEKIEFLNEDKNFPVPLGVGVVIN